jgi:nucleoside-diphosphate-sugar epimerase
MTKVGAQEIRGDLLEPRTLRGACDGVATVLHLATHISDDEDLCDAVNNDGTRVLLEEARTSGVERVVHLSTTAIYGHGVHRGASESILPPAPVSATSRSRLKAERLVREAGGIVLRPHLVYGAGDRWFLPTLLNMLDRVPAWIERGGAKTSLVSVEDLAAVAATLTRMPWGPSKGAVFHVSHPQPVSFRAVTERAYGELGLTLPENDLPAHEHRELTRRALPRLTDHQFELLAYDHWYNSSRIWQYTGVNPGAGAVTRLPAATSWYRKHIPVAA